MLTLGTCLLWVSQKVREASEIDIDALTKFVANLVSLE
jgi:hypothetical protein